jgi:hypothetical protein
MNWDDVLNAQVERWEKMNQAEKRKNLLTPRYDHSRDIWCVYVINGAGELQTIDFDDYFDAEDFCNEQKKLDREINIEAIQTCKNSY